MSSPQEQPTTSQPTEGELLVKTGGGPSMAFTFGDPVPVQRPLV
jgi:hypothetical protein